MLIITVHNVSPPGREICDYKCEVLINTEVIATAFIKDHKREDGWRALLGRVAEEAIDAE